MADLSNPHDLFFKDMFSRPEVAADFLKSYLPPEVAALLDGAAAAGPGAGGCPRGLCRVRQDRSGELISVSPA